MTVIVMTEIIAWMAFGGVLLLFLYLVWDYYSGRRDGRELVEDIERKARREEGR